MSTLFSRVMEAYNPNFGQPEIDRSECSHRFTMYDQAWLDNHEAHLTCMDP